MQTFTEVRLFPVREFRIFYLAMCEKFKYNELSIDSADIHTMDIKRRKRSWTDMHINVLFE